MNNTPNSKPNLASKTSKEATPKTVSKQTKVIPTKPTTSSKFAHLLKEIEKMTIQELNTFVKEIQSYFDITPIAVAASNGQDQKAKVPDKVSVIITESGQSKVALIKAIGAITGKGLMDSKKILDQIPATIVSDKSTNEAADIKKQLENAGATVQIK